jgi:heme exporter protein B
MTSVGKMITLFRKDLRYEWRTKESLSSMSIFALLTLFIFHFAFGPGAQSTREVSSGILWVAIAFSSVIGLNRSFIYEKDQGCLPGLLLCPVDRSLIYFGKVLGNAAIMLMVECLILPIFSLFFRLSVLNPLPKLIPIIILSTIGFSAVGTLLSAISVNTRAREVMLPVLFFPMIIPVILAAVKSTSKAMAGKSFADIGTWLLFLIGFDIIYLIVSPLIFEFVLEE